MKIEHKDRGWKITTDNGEIVYFGEYGQLNANEGVIYKDYAAFESGEGVCYIPEYGFDNEEQNSCEFFEFEAKEAEASDLIDNSYQTKKGENTYTKQDFIELCNGDEKLAKIVFDTCDWTFPETILDEMEECDFE